MEGGVPQGSRRGKTPRAPLPRGTSVPETTTTATATTTTNNNNNNDNSNDNTTNNNNDDNSNSNNNNNVRGTFVLHYITRAAEVCVLSMKHGSAPNVMIAIIIIISISISTSIIIIISSSSSSIITIIVVIGTSHAPQRSARRGALGGGKKSGPKYKMT